MATTFHSLDVIGIIDGEGPIVGLRIDRAKQVRDFLMPGSGWSDLVCAECGESAAWCPRLVACLPTAWVEARRA